MVGHSHMIVGVASWTLFASQFDYVVDLPTACMAVLGGLLPDIDHPRSMITNSFAPFKMIAKMVPHRGPTHSLLAIFLLVFGLSQFFEVHDGYFKGWMIAFLCGYMSHIVADWMTKGGVPLFWPFGKRTHMPFAFYTGSATERVIVVLMVLGMGLYFAGVTHEDLINLAQSV